MTPNLRIPHPLAEFAEFGEMTEMTEFIPSVDPRLSELAEFGEMSELIPSVDSSLPEFGEMTEMTELIPSVDLKIIKLKKKLKKNRRSTTELNHVPQYSSEIFAALSCIYRSKSKS